MSIETGGFPIFRKIIFQRCFYVFGIDALNYVKYTVPDGIILDLMIPGINGFEVLEKIRNSCGKTANIPVLILTAKDLTSED